MKAGAFLLPCALGAGPTNLTGVPHVLQSTDRKLLHTSANWKSDCGKRLALLQSNVSNPGAGMEPKEIEPYTTVLKDGYMMVDCVKDSMYEYGDKFGDNRHAYKMEDISGVSIVRYSDHVPKEDRKAMSPAVCFEFCRTIPEMGFFGISNGRDCYCTPYYEAMESDSSDCDATCLGEPSQFCGGKSKNSIFSMHMCADTDSELSSGLDEAKDAQKKIDDLINEIENTAEDAESSANAMQESLGTAGDPVASELMQSAKKWIGELAAATSDAEAFNEKLQDVVDDGSALEGGDFEDFEQAKKADAAIEALSESTAEAVETEKKLKKMLAATAPEVEAERSADSAKQYMPIMHFVDAEHESVPSTCGGKTVGMPLFGLSKDDCAATCDSEVGKCVGFSFFKQDSSICFLYEEFTSVQFYTGCGGGGKSFLQVETGSAPFDAECYAKLMKFEGTTLKPDPSGKCKQCLKEATKADRCYE